MATITMFRDINVDDAFSPTFVAVVFGSTAAASTTDPATGAWTARTLPSASNWNSLAYGNKMIVAVSGSTTVAASSPDGVTWTARTLTSFNSLISDIWGKNTNQSTTTSAQIEKVGSELKAQRELLERLINEPIITSSLEDNPEPDLKAKFNEAEKTLSSLYDNTSLIKTKLLTLLSKWDSLNNSARATTITSIRLTLTPTIEKDIQWFTKAWDYPLIQSLTPTLTSYQSNLAVLSQELSRHPTSTPNSLIKTLESIDQMLAYIGNESTTKNKATLFGLLTSLKNRAEKIKTVELATHQFLINWDRISTHEKLSLASKAKSQILDLSEYPDSDSFFSQDPLKPENTIYAGLALLKLNHRLLSQNSGEKASVIWLENGSVVFRISMYNPSPIISQTVPLKFTLPPELSEKDLEQLDSSLSVSYDPLDSKLQVMGSYTLSPLETRVVSIKAKDVWTISDEELNSIRKSSENYLTALAKTPLFSQGVLIKTNIDSLLDQFNNSSSYALSPEQRIKEYRISKLKLLSAKTQLTRLEDLVAQASSNSSLIGTLGGAQLGNTWGIIIVILGGFVLLGLYLYQQEARRNPRKLPLITENDNPRLLPTPVNTIPWSIYGFIILTTGIISTGTTLFFTKRNITNPSTINQIEAATTPLPSIVSQVEPVSTPLPTTNPTPKTELEIATLTPPTPTNSINIRNQPSLSGDIVTNIKKETEVIIFDRKDGWAQIGFTSQDKPKGYWVKIEFLTSQ